MSPLAVASKAPEFTLPASNGTNVSLMDYRGLHHVVLYFYPKDMTPGCTAEAVAFRDLQDEFELAGAAIIGVSTDDLASHAKFAGRHNLTFPVLSDAEGKVAARFGVLNDSSGTGEHRAERVTFVIDKDGMVVRVLSNIRLECHADEVLAYVHAHNSPAHRRMATAAD
jgi:peroxiredoxin Q/BCP